MKYLSLLILKQRRRSHWWIWSIVIVVLWFIIIRLLAPLALTQASRFFINWGKLRISCVGILFLVLFCVYNFWPKQRSKIHILHLTWLNMKQYFSVHLITWGLLLSFLVFIGYVSWLLTSIDITGIQRVTRSLEAYGILLSLLSFFLLISSLIKLFHPLLFGFLTIVLYLFASSLDFIKYLLIKNQNRLLVGGIDIIKALLPPVGLFDWAQMSIHTHTTAIWIMSTLIYFLIYSVLWLIVGTHLITSKRFT